MTSSASDYAQYALRVFQHVAGMGPLYDQVWRRESRRGEPASSLETDMHMLAVGELAMAALSVGHRPPAKEATSMSVVFAAWMVAAALPHELYACCDVIAGHTNCAPRYVRVRTASAIGNLGACESLQRQLRVDIAKEIVAAEDRQGCSTPYSATDSGVGRLVYAVAAFLDRLPRVPDFA